MPPGSLPRPRPAYNKRLFISARDQTFVVCVIVVYNEFKPDQRWLGFFGRCEIPRPQSPKLFDYGLGYLYLDLEGRTAARGGHPICRDAT